MSHHLIMLYISTKFCQSISEGFRVMDLDSRVDARVVANVDIRMDRHMAGRTNTDWTENRIPISRHA